MARARSLKPGFFKNEELSTLQPLARLLFAGLWTLADREGRLEDRPARIRAEVLPYDDGVNMGELLTALEGADFISRYEVAGVRVILINNFPKHQKPHHMELPSELPPPPGVVNKFNHGPINREQRTRIMERDGAACRLCGSIERPSIDHIIPVSAGGTSDDSNLQILCLPCNRRKGNKVDGEYTVRDRVDVESSTAQRQCDNASTNLRVDIPVPLTLNPIPLTLNPEPSTPEPATASQGGVILPIEDNFEEFKAAGIEAGVRCSNADWEESKYTWRLTGFDRKLRAVDGYRERLRLNAIDDSALKALPKNYLIRQMYDREIRAPVAPRQQAKSAIDRQNEIIQRKERERLESSRSN